MEKRLDLLSKPKIKLSVIDEVMQGQLSSDPLLVINSMDAPTLHVEVACLAMGREVGYLTKNYEEGIYVLDGKAVVCLRENGAEQRYEMEPSDSIFVPAAVPSKLVNAGDRPLKIFRGRGVSLNPTTATDVNAPWPETSGYYGVPPLIEKEKGDIRGHKRLVKAGEDMREYAIHTVMKQDGRLQEGAQTAYLQRVFEYSNCGSRTISGCVATFGPGQGQDPHWQNFDEIVYVAKGPIRQFEGPEDSVVELNAEEGDLCYSPNQVRHYQIAPNGGKIIVFWGVYTVPWIPQIWDGVHGTYTDDDIHCHLCKSDREGSLFDGQKATVDRKPLCC